MIAVICYDLRSPSKDYEPLFALIKKQGRWWHYLKSTWILETNKTLQQIIDEIEPLLSTTDRVMAFEMSGEYYGILPQRAWKWIERHIEEKQS